MNTFHRLLQSDAAESRPHLYPRSAQIRGSLEHSVCCSPSMPPNPRNLFISCCTAAHLHCPIKPWCSQQLPVQQHDTTICTKQHTYTYTQHATAQHTPLRGTHQVHLYTASTSTPIHCRHLSGRRSKFTQYTAKPSSSIPSDASFQNLLQSEQVSLVCSGLT